MVTRRVIAKCGQALLLGRIVIIDRGGPDRKASSASLLHHGDLLGRVDGAGDVDGLGNRGANRFDECGSVFLGSVGEKIQAMRPVACRDRSGTVDEVGNAPFQYAWVARDTTREGAILDVCAGDHRQDVIDVRAAQQNATPISAAARAERISLSRSSETTSR